MTIGRWAALGASAALAVAATASPARAQADPARGTWQLYWENDSFLRGATTDESYTNGLRFAILGAEGGDIGPGWARGGLPRWWLSHIANANEANFILTSGYTFGQTFYTPEEINTTVLNPNDRPWAGWLYFGVLSQMTRQDFREEHLIELDV
ncbi:MAG TPA: lipid A-modifier LpxR family protein, partial [bacterium]|nr:lipid A-modifier LpxR family protein [bacterium]